MYAQMIDEQMKKGTVTRKYRVGTHARGEGDHLHEYEITAVEKPGVNDTNLVTITRGKVTHIEGEAVPRDHVPSVVRRLVAQIECGDRIDDVIDNAPGVEPKPAHEAKAQYVNDPKKKRTR